jgi:hypothetical protein
MIEAVTTETFKWLTFAKLFGLTIFRDGKPLKGQLVVNTDPADDEKSINHYLTSHVHQILKRKDDGTLEVTEGKNPMFIVENIWYGSPDEVTFEELREAVVNWRKKHA